MPTSPVPAPSSIASFPFNSTFPRSRYMHMTTAWETDVTRIQLKQKCSMASNTVTKNTHRIPHDCCYPKLLPVLGQTEIAVGEPKVCG